MIEQPFQHSMTEWMHAVYLISIAGIFFCLGIFEERIRAEVLKSKIKELEKEKQIIQEDLDDMLIRQEKDNKKVKKIKSKANKIKRMAKKTRAKYRT